MGRKEFKARLEGMGPGGAWAILTVPFDVEEVWGTRASVPVKGKLNGCPFRGSVIPMGYGRHSMMVDKALQEAAGVGPGDSVKVVMEKDTAKRAVKVPRDLKAALARNKKAREAFEKLPPSHKKEYVEFIEEAKKAETRAGRIKKTVQALAAAKRKG